MERYDFHSHLGKTRSGDNNSAEQMIQQLSSFGIKKVGIVSLSQNSVQENNDLIAAAMVKFPDFVVGYADIDPKLTSAYDEVDRTLGDIGMNGVKFMSWKHGYSVENCPQLESVVDYITHYDVHIQIHGGASPLCTPYIWTRFAKKHPNTNFVFTHICGREFGTTCIELIEDIPNFYVETSANEEINILRSAVSRLGSKRILFGTDWPYKPTNIEIDKLYELGLSDSELEDIFYHNASHLWNIE